MKRKAMKVLIIILMIFVLLAALFVWWFPSFVLGGKRQTLEEAFAWQSEHYDTSFYEKLEKQDYTIEGYEGYTLHAEFLKNSDKATKYIILTHGYSDNRMGSLKYVPMYLELGFNCIIYDLRGHGENEAAVATYGMREAKDLIEVIKDSKKRYPDMTCLALHGESLGAATTVTAMQYQPDVDFAVADCGFSDIENVLRGVYKSVHLPQGLFDVADLGSKIRYHYSLKEMRPIDALDENTVPILFIHGADDTFILPKNSEDMAKRTKGMNEIHLIKGAGHALSILTDPEAYKGYVKGFMEKLQ